MVDGSPPLPELPLLAPWYRLVEDGRRLVLEHGGRVVALEGAAATALLPRLLPLLDGTRTIDEIVAVVGVPAEPAVRNALALLAERSLVVDGPGFEAGGELADTVAWLAAGADSSAAALAGRLADATVAIVGNGVAVLEAARLLRRSGVARLDRRDWDDGASGADLAVVGPAVDEVRHLPTWNDAALRSAQRWLPVLPYDGRFVAVGPLVVPGETACYACYRLRRAASLGVGELSDALDGEPPRAGGGAALAAAAGAVAAAHALRWIALADPALPGTLHALEPGGGLRLTAHQVLRVPRCPACSERRRLAAPLPWYQPDRVGEVA